MFWHIFSNTTDGTRLDLEPWNHTTACMLLSSADTDYACQENGYALLERKLDDTYEYKYALDRESNELALAMLKASKKEKNITVQAEGYVCGGSVMLTVLNEVIEGEDTTSNGLVPPFQSAIAWSVAAAAASLWAAVN